MFTHRRLFLRRIVSLQQISRNNPKLNKIICYKVLLLALLLIRLLLLLLDRNICKWQEYLIITKNLETVHTVNNTHTHMIYLDILRNKYFFIRILLSFKLKSNIACFRYNANYLDLRIAKHTSTILYCWICQL